MAYTTGTASGHYDLLAQLRDFITQHGWEVISGVATGTPISGDYISFKGTGLAGDDEILASVQASGNVAAGQYNWRLYGHTAYNLDVPGVDQPGNFVGDPGMLLISGEIVYWFICNPRCFKVITRINGRYDACYVGFFLPDHSPDNYAYPLFIGASSASIANRTAADDTSFHSNFWRGWRQDYKAASSNANYHFVNPAGAWRSACDSVQQEGFAPNVYGQKLLPWAPAYYQTKTRRNIDGTPWLQRAELVQIGEGSGANSGGKPTDLSVDGGVWYGSLDGVFFTPAFGAVAEELITLNGVDHLVVPNIARTGNRSFAAFALE